VTEWVHMAETDRPAQNRACIFCGGTPLTVEHVWPEWVARLFDTTSVRITRSGSKPVAYSARTIELKAAVVCEPCNTGWMNRVENAARPILTPMIKGQCATLDRPAQFVAAFWAVKTAMVFECALSQPLSEIYWSQTERETMRVEPHSTVPVETLVRVAAHAGDGLAYGRAGRSHLTTIAGRDHGVHGARITLMVGSLVLQVEADRWTGMTGSNSIWWPPQYNSQSEWLWPIQHDHLHWPTAAPLDEAALMAFSGAGGSGAVAVDQRSGTLITDDDREHGK
jgi:hypothetical protein